MRDLCEKSKEEKTGDDKTKPRIFSPAAPSPPPLSLSARRNPCLLSLSPYCDFSISRSAIAL
jgi:hypothetical protein